MDPPAGCTEARAELDWTGDAYILALVTVGPDRTPQDKSLLVGAVEPGAEQDSDEAAAQALQEFLDAGDLSPTPSLPSVQTGATAWASELLGSAYRAVAALIDAPAAGERLASYRT